MVLYSKFNGVVVAMFLIVPVVNPKVAGQTIALTVDLPLKCRPLHQGLLPLLWKAIPTPMGCCNIMRTTTHGITETTGLDTVIRIPHF